MKSASLQPLFLIRYHLGGPARTGLPEYLTRGLHVAADTFITIDGIPTSWYYLIVIDMTQPEIV